MSLEEPEGPNRRCSLRTTQNGQEQSNIDNGASLSSTQFRRATIGDLGASPHLLAPPSSNTTKRIRKQSTSSAIDFDLAKSIMRSRKNSQQIDPSKLHILRIEKYNKLYNSILNDLTKAKKHTIEEDRSKDKNQVRQSIKKTIRMDSEESEFREKFSIGNVPRKRKSRSVRAPGIGNTTLERETQRRKSFFEDHRKVVQLQQECLLLEYYLKDQQQQEDMRSTQYLRTLSKTSQHRRITPNNKTTHDLFTIHSEKQYSAQKRRIQIKQQFVEQCLSKARKNSGYRRRDNFRQMQYVQQEHQRALHDQNTMPMKSDDEIDNGCLVKQLQRNGKLIRLYLNYKWFPVGHPNADQAQNQHSYLQFKQNLFALNNVLPYKEKQIDDKMKEMMRYKHQRCMHFQDFKELVMFIEDLTGKDIVLEFENKMPGYFTTSRDKVIQQKWKQIDRYYTANKIKFLLKVMFKTFPEQLLSGGQLLPIKVIPSILKSYNITEKDYNLKQMLRTYHWVQHHDVGITFEEFYRGSVLMRMKKDSDWKALEAFLRKVNIRKFI